MSGVIAVATMRRALGRGVGWSAIVVCCGGLVGRRRVLDGRT